MTEEDKVRMDAVLHGTGIMVDGKRVDPARVRLQDFGTSDLAFRIAQWALGEDRGTSSECLARETLGINTGSKTWGISYPHDCGDFGRCYRLTQAVPEARAAVDRLAGKSKKWRQLAAHWDRLSEIYAIELNEGKVDRWGYTQFPRTYNAIKALGV